MIAQDTKTDAAAELIALEDQYGAHNYHPLDVVIARADGAWVTDLDGHRYLDFLAAYSAVNQGHCHPAILRALIEQAQKVTLTSRAFRNDQLPLLLRDLHDLTGFSMALPMNSGVEAVETALKAARKWGATVKGVPAGRARSSSAPTTSTAAPSPSSASPPKPNTEAASAPFPPASARSPSATPTPSAHAITPNTVAFLVEPIQGEAGIIVPPPATSPRPPDLREHNVLLICDEIQSGLGRTGTPLRLPARRHPPDVCILGKALSGGFYPVSAVLASREILGVFRPGDHGSTFGGNPLACAVARAALQVLVDEDLPARSAELGAYALNRLQSTPPPIRRTSAARASGSASSSTSPPAPSAKPSRTAASSARKPTTPSSASLRPSSSPATTSPGASTRSKPSSAKPDA